MPEDKAPVVVNEAWCKGCDICINYCPKQVLARNAAGKASVVKPEACILCENCELLCPDFAITLTRRRAKGSSATSTSVAQKGGGSR